MYWPFCALLHLPIALAVRVKSYFPWDPKCHLRIDRGQSSRSVFFMCSKNTMLPLGAKKIAFGLGTFVSLQIDLYS